MYGLYLVALVVTVSVAVYLVAVLFYAEDFP